MKVTFMKSKLPKLVLTSIFLLSTSTFAADKINWTGPYIGGSLGYGWGEQHAKDISADLGPTYGIISAPAGSFVADTKPSMNSGFGGLQAGYNFMSNEKILLGIEAGFIGGSFSSNYTPNLSNPLASGMLGQNFSAHSKIDWIGTFKAKAGTFIEGNLIYIDGGLAVSKQKLNTQSLVGDTEYYSSNSQTLTGWVLGAGAELPIYNNLTAKIDYQHIEFGDKTIGLSNVDPEITSLNVKGSNNLDMLSVGLNYHF